MNLLYKASNRILNPLGIEINPFPAGVINRRLELIRLHQIDMLVDVGAGLGQYGKLMRRIGYRGNIVSFEPLTRSFQEVKAITKNDDGWSVENYALGSFNGKEKIQISGNPGSSSLLTMSDVHVQSAPHTGKVGEQEISVMTLDSFAQPYAITAERNIFMKIDVQGYEMHVLRGAKDTLPIISGLQVEMSFSELYHGAPKFDDLKKYIEAQGFTLCLLEPGFSDPRTGKLHQVDGIFFRL